MLESNLEKKTLCTLYWNLQLLKVQSEIQGKPAPAYKHKTKHNNHFTYFCCLNNVCAIDLLIKLKTLDFKPLTYLILIYF